MRRLIVSMMRFSTAVTLFGYEQVQSSLEMVRGKQELNDGLDRLQSAIDSLSDALVGHLGDGQRESLESITSMAEEGVKRILGDGRFLDPREIIKATADVIRQSSEAVVGRITNAATIEGEEPKPAADVLV